jgi:hypothetical protein
MTPKVHSRFAPPSVHVWQDDGNTVIAGTLISPGTFVEISTRTR